MVVIAHAWATVVAGVKGKGGRGGACRACLEAVYVPSSTRIAALKRDYRWFVSRARGQGRLGEVALFFVDA